MQTLNREWLDFERSQLPIQATEAPVDLAAKRREQARQTLQRNATYLCQYEPQLGEAVVVSDSTVRARDGVNISIRIYDSNQPPDRPVVVFYHGGALVGWDLNTEDLSCRRMAIECSTVVISVAYRLAPENPYPIPINDAWDSFLNIAENIATIVPRYAGPANFVIAGTSSGGHLAAIVSQLAAAHMKTQETPAWTVSGVVLRSPVTVYGADKQYIPPQFRDIHQSWVPELDCPGRLCREDMKNGHDLYGVPDSDKTNPLAYPLWGNLAGLPRTFVQICGVDILRDDAVCYVKGLTNAGVDVQSKFYEDLPHVFWVYAPHLEVSQKMEQDCVGGLNWVISEWQSEILN
ncbi:hypothetical protein EMPG_10926 [Blastomyces silverae]|uniref:Alpha/beta hydrolase fold-3 domain-containing protein n=1 Tax=Blastomyces silverae TaxID=2060906 RepID=A0A0H1B3C7_9EURO|nr:hypothetical protein EMPG_10926 [Blastomyces silverae]